LSVVIDTNTWISALQFGIRRDGTTSTPLQAVMRASAFDRILICHEIREEILEVLTRKFRWEKAIASSTIEEWLQFAKTIEISGEKMGCRDPDDDIFLECAIKGPAEVLVTGHEDLLVFNPFRGVKITPPKEYVAS
jgi:putative PIN family toxin of toxin-antitoxin system